jgi:acetylornithine deacetylase
MAAMHRPSAASLEMIRRLVAFDTTSRDSNLPLIEWVRSYLAGHGIECELVFDDTGKKANLYATLGPKGVGGICLSGHTDVVPVDGQDWHSNPFEIVEKDGRLYGRGTCDMKSFVAVCLAFVPEFLGRGLETPIHLAFSYDEEIGCIGVRRLIDKLAARPDRPTLCIVGEPTEMKVARAHKGKKSWRCHVRGLECHSSLAPRGVNAVEAAAEIIARWRQMGARIRAERPQDPDFDVPYTTLHTGVVRGGTALNIVPKECYFDFEVRHLPTDDPDALFTEIKRFAEEELLPPMRAVSADAGFAWTPLSATPGLDMAEEHPATTFVKSLTGQNATTKMAIGTEAGLFQRGGIPTIIIGPGSVDQAHTPDEFVALDQVAQCEEMMRRLADRVCRTAR